MKGQRGQGVVAHPVNKFQGQKGVKPVMHMPGICIFGFAVGAGVCHGLVYTQCLQALQ